SLAELLVVGLQQTDVLLHDRETPERRSIGSARPRAAELHREADPLTDASPRSAFSRISRTWFWLRRAVSNWATRRHYFSMSQEIKAMISTVAPSIKASSLFWLSCRLTR